MDCVGQHVYDMLAPRVQRSCCGEMNLPMFHISSASAATVDSICNSWISSSSHQQDGDERKMHPIVRIVLITAASAPLPAPGLHRVSVDGGCGTVVHAEAHILSSESRIEDVLSVDHLNEYLGYMTEREAAFAQSLKSIPSFNGGASSDAGTVSPTEHDASLVVPIYFLRVPMQDNGSQRLRYAMGGITSFLNSCCGVPAASGEGHCYLRHSIVHNTSALRECLAPSPVASSKPDNSVAVLVHCLQGISRSVSVVVWYLVEQLHGICHPPPSVDEVLEWIRAERACACPNLCFAAELFCMEKRLRVAPSA